MPEGGPDPRWKIVRGFARFVVDLPFTILFSETGSEGAIRGRMTDLSLGGLHGILAEDVAVGQRLWVEFALPGAAEPLRIRCRVCHGFDRAYGFQFLNITPEQRDLVRAACQDLRIV